MAEGTNGKTRTALVAATLSLMTVVFTSYNVWQDNQRQAITEERNQTEANLCDNINQLNDALGLILRLAAIPEEGDSPQEIAASEKFRDEALEELMNARCTVSPVTPR